MVRLRSFLLLATLVGCGSKAAPAPATPPPTTAAAGPADRAPEVYPPAWHKVGVGQTISFGTSAIDQDLDETRVMVTKLPASATFDAITQTVTWTPTTADLPAQTFELTITQPARGTNIKKTFTIDVDAKPQPAPVAPRESAAVESLFVIREPARLTAINADWPIDKLLLLGAQEFRYQFTADQRAKLGPVDKLDKGALYASFLTGLAQTHNNPRLDPASPSFDKVAFGDPSAWKIVTFRPRIDKAWTELRVVYQAVNAREPVFAMFRLRPGVEYAPPTAGPAGQTDDDNKRFLDMVARHLLDKGGVSQRLYNDPAAEAKEVDALMTEVMTYDDLATAEYRHGFEIGIATEARMGGGSLRNPDGSYKSGDGWGWSAMKPFTSNGGTNQAYVNVGIPGFWTQAVPSKDGSTWDPACAPRFAADDPAHVPGYEALCRKTLGFVDLPNEAAGKVRSGTIDANNLYLEHKQKWEVEHLALEDGRRDLGEENGMTCSQCHIRNFGMHDYGDPAATDPSKGTPRAPNHSIPTLNFQIVPTTNWEAFTLEFVKHQECRAKLHYEHYLGSSALTCPLAK